MLLQQSKMLPVMIMPTSVLKYSTYTMIVTWITSPSRIVAKRDIKAGEEIFANHVYYTVGDEQWREEVKSIQRMYSGEEIGFIAKKEKDV